MERRDAAVERQVIKSVVTVVGGSNYCSGFVARIDERDTYIVTQSYFVKGREELLRVRFWEGEKEASVVGKIDGPLCLLRTDPHPGCQAVRVLDEDIQHGRTLIFPPSSPTTHFRIPSFVTAESLPAYSVSTDQVIQGTAIQFLLTCHYGSRSADGFNRLVAAPVYNMRGYFVGTVIDNCLNHVKTEMGDLGNEMRGTEMKVVVPAKTIPVLVSHILGKQEQIERSKRKLGGVDCFKERGNVRGKGRPKGLHTSK